MVILPSLRRFTASRWRCLTCSQTCSHRKPRVGSTYPLCTQHRLFFCVSFTALPLNSILFLKSMNVTAAEWMRSFHLFALYSTGGTSVPLRAEKLKCSVCPGFLLYFYRFQTPGWQPLLTWCYTVERVSCFGCMCEDWEMSTDRFKLPCRFCAAVTLFPSHVWVTPVHPCTSVSFCVTSRLTHPHAIELQLLEV